MPAVKKYPELDAIAKDIADTVCRKINHTVVNVENDMTSNTQYILEKVITILQDRV